MPAHIEPSQHEWTQFEWMYAQNPALWIATDRGLAGVRRRTYPRRKQVTAQIAVKTPYEALREYNERRQKLWEAMDATSF